MEHITPPFEETGENLGESIATLLRECTRYAYEKKQHALVIELCDQYEKNLKKISTKLFLGIDYYCLWASSCMALDQFEKARTILSKGKALLVDFPRFEDDVSQVEQGIARREREFVYKPSHPAKPIQILVDYQ
jgi:hypothetical protein